MPQLIHGNCLEVQGVGCLIIGAASSGKSSLTAELLLQGANLIADDQVLLMARNRMLCARAPEPLKGILELHGLGIIDVSEQSTEEANVELVFHCHDRLNDLEAIPTYKQAEWLGISIPSYDIALAHHATAAKIMLFCKAWREGRIVDGLSTTNHQRAQ